MHIPAESIIPFPASKQRDFCLFIDLVLSLAYTGQSQRRCDRYKDISKQPSTAGNPRTQAIQRLRVCFVYKCPLLTHKNKTNGSNRQFDGRSGWQLHIFWGSICHTHTHTQQPNMCQTMRRGQESTWLSIWVTFDLCFLTLLAHSVAWQMRGQNRLVDHLLSLSRVTLLVKWLMCRKSLFDEEFLLHFTHLLPLHSMTIRQKCCTSVLVWYQQECGHYAGCGEDRDELEGIGFRFIRRSMLQLSPVVMSFG